MHRKGAALVLGMIISSNGLIFNQGDVYANEIELKDNHAILSELIHTREKDNSFGGFEPDIDPDFEVDQKDDSFGGFEEPLDPDFGVDKEPLDPDYGFDIRPTIPSISYDKPVVPGFGPLGTVTPEL